MRFLFKRRWANVLAVGLMLFVSAAAILTLLIMRDTRPPSLREFAVIRDDWERTLFGHALEGGPLTFLADRNAKPLTGAAREEKIASLAESCLTHAEKYPNTTGELAALYLAATRGSATEAGIQAREKLIKRIATADLAKLQEAIRTSRSGKLPEISPAIFNLVKQNPNHPKSAALLTYVCLISAGNLETKEVPPLFAEAADLIAARYAESKDISNFCEILGNGYGGPPWASQFERHLRTILDENRERWVRCTASMALASIAQSSIERQAEAEELYQRFVQEFNGKTDYHAQYAEQDYCRRAEMQLTAMKFTPIGRLAPEISGTDLNGQAMTLSEYRGKVVLLSFWATWCGPCMKLIPHERELALRLADQPFVIVGVNADDNAESIEKAVREQGITWRSFHDKRNGAKAISDDWSAVFPTVYLIDHKGLIRQRFTGAPDPEILKQLVDELVQAANLE